MGQNTGRVIHPFPRAISIEWIQVASTKKIQFLFSVLITITRTCPPIYIYIYKESDSLEKIEKQSYPKGINLLRKDMTQGQFLSGV